MSIVSIASIGRADDVSRGDWERLSPPGHPFLNINFFGSLERHAVAGPSCGWHACHQVATGSDKSLLGIMPSYIKTNSHGDFLRDWSWAAAYEQLGKAYFPKLISGLPHTPASGPRFLLDKGWEFGDLCQQFIIHAKELVAERQFSSWHVALPTCQEVAALRENGLLVSHDVQFQWRDRGYGDFDGYLATFPSDKRRKVRAERRKVVAGGISIEVRHGNEIAPDEWPALYELYAMTFEKYGNYAAFSASCFAELGDSLGRRMVVFVARNDSGPVAISLCFRSNDTLYGRYWGSNGRHHSLHFELCFYQGIAYCLREGLKTFEPGAGGEHKVSRGFEPTLVRSCHWIADGRMRHLIGQHLERQRLAIESYAAEAASHLPFRATILE